jgi:hypothetical protein
MKAQVVDRAITIFLVLEVYLYAYKLFQMQVSQIVGPVA